MSENDRVDLTRRNRHILPIAFTPFFLALKESAINQDLKAIFAARICAGVNQVLGAGHGPRRAKKLDVGQASLL